VVQLASRRATYLGVMNEVDPVTSDLPAFEPGVQAVAEAIAELRRGRMVVVIDGEGGEDEGVLMLPAESATAQSVAFMVRYTSGFLCAAMTDQRADALGLPLMVAHSDNPRGTALTVSVDVKAGVTTGISAKDRAATIQALGASTTRREDLNRPGHVFASRARPGGVLSRAGRTESAVDLCVLAGFGGVGVLAQVVNSDGSAARSDQLNQFASAHSLTAVTIADIVRYRRRTEQLVRQVAQAGIPTDYGEFTAITFRYAVDGSDHVAFVYGDMAGGKFRSASKPPLVGIHSECVAGDVFGSRSCDCHPRLTASMSRVAESKHGAVLYLRGRRGDRVGLSHQMPPRLHRGDDPHFIGRASRAPHVDGHGCDIAAQMLKNLGATTVAVTNDDAALLARLTRVGIEVLSDASVAPLTPWAHVCRQPAERLRHKRALVLEVS
jgi:3,4-dihydroxy 2-butanone 4-phosphate synthase / GTP cyclohydrolase II